MALLASRRAAGPPARQRLTFAAALLVAVVGSSGAAAQSVRMQQQREHHTAADCGQCHREIHAEWQRSAHATAFTDPAFQQELRSRQRPERCIPCHAPQSVPERLGRMPRARSADPHEGITCVACHRRGEQILGPFGAATEAHDSAADPTFQGAGSTALCSGCHDLRIADVLPLAREFAAAGFGADGRSCASCHMPAVTRPLAVDPASGAATGPARAGRSHALLGPDDAAFCQQAFEFRVEQRGKATLVHVANTAGHGVPGLVARRVFAIALRQLDAAGRVLHEQTVRISGDNRLLVGEDREVQICRQPGAVRVAVQVDHYYLGKLLATLVQQELPLP
jgi:hypothetical protein